LADFILNGSENAVGRLYLFAFLFAPIQRPDARAAALDFM
jgi:hypothetical protein